ncbi:MAG TPA: hypothetical protein VH639_01740 [Bryobacteraceae bacterium]|jgi:hypothetical protein
MGKRIVPSVERALACNRGFSPGIGEGDMSARGRKSPLQAKSLLHFGVFLILALPVLAQTIPRMADGKPNFNGIWQSMNTANWDLEDHSAQVGPVVAAGAIGAEPAGLGIIEGAGTIPYKSEALKKRNENFKNRAKEDPEIKCYLPGVPRATYIPYPFQITQTNGDILINYSYDTATRVVLMTKHRDAELDTWMGTNNGHWDGDTLVIDATGFNGRAWLDRAGNFAGDSLHVVERYRMLDANTIDYEATLEDPDTFTKPWKINFPLYRHREKNARLLQFQCVEFVEEFMYGDLSKKR